jgi:hypothetical protein
MKKKKCIMHIMVNELSTDGFLCGRRHTNQPEWYTLSLQSLLNKEVVGNADRVCKTCRKVANSEAQVTSNTYNCTGTSTVSSSWTVDVGSGSTAYITLHA